MKKIRICSSHAHRTGEDSVIHEAMLAGYSEDLPVADRDRILEEASWRLEDSLPLTSPTPIPGSVARIAIVAGLRGEERSGDA